MSMSRMGLGLAPAVDAAPRACGVWRTAAGIMSVDARSLALMRIVLAACLLVDLGQAVADFPALFSDAGVLPRQALHGFWWPGVENSFYLMSGLPVVNYALLAVHAVAILALLVGYRTRAAVIACLLFTISLQARNFMADQGSDDLARLLLFGGLFVPLGGRWSVDAALSTRQVPQRLLSFGVVAIQVQAMCVYTFGALIKAEGTAWPGGHAVAMALADGTYGTALGRLFLGMPVLLQGVTYAVSALELLMPLLIWFPLANARVRTVSLLAVIAMHLTFLLLLNVGIFPFVSFASLLLFVTARHWAWLEGWWRPGVRCAAMFYDQECGFCYKTCLLLRNFCLPATVLIGKAQDDAVAGPLLVQHNSWVVRDDRGGHHVRWAAVCFVLRQSPVFWVFGWLGERPGLREVGDRLYGMIGRNRGALGRVTARLLPYRELDGRRRLVSEALAAAFIGVILLYNLGGLRATAWMAPQGFRAFTIDTRLEQYWSMFAPNPRDVTDWAVMRAVTADGRVLDVFGGVRRPYSEASPADGRVTYANSKWKKYYERLFLPGYAPLRGYYAQWVCREVNVGAAGGARVVQVTLKLFVEQPFAANPPARTVQDLWTQRCP